MRTITILGALAGLAGLSAAWAQTASAPLPVNVDNFARAESDLYFSQIVKDGGFGKFHHNREPTPVDNQTVIRMNRDTLYSTAVFDLDAAPVTITLPDAGTRFMSMMVLDQDEYVPAVFYGAGAHTLNRATIGTRYVMVSVRTLVDPGNAADVQQVHKLQDGIAVRQQSTGRFEIPNWDQVSQKKIRDALLVLGSTMPDYKRAFGAKGRVDPVRHLVGAATGWGGNPDEDATYVSVTVPKNDGATRYGLTVARVPVDGFWSVSVYNAQGYFEKNAYDAYAVNNVTAKASADGSIRIQFGGCDGKIPNCLPIMPGWNSAVRLYRPRAEILDGTWKFPNQHRFERAACASARTAMLALGLGQLLGAMLFGERAFDAVTSALRSA